MIEFKNFVQILKYQGLNSNKGITFITGKDDLYVSYKKIYTKACHLLLVMKESGIKKSDEILLQLEKADEFVVAFWACILGGFIPVPVSVGNNSEHRLKLIRIWKTLNNPYLITTESVFERIIKFTDENETFEIQNQFKSKSIIFTCDDYEKEVDNFHIDIEDNISSNEIAFIQFSSGSTGKPKGVIVTHGSLISNIISMIDGAEVTRKDIFFSWMPLTHDMGLIGFHLLPLLAGIDQYIIPTSLFIRKPTLWLEKVTQYRATFTASPNFGYKYFLRFFKRRKECNLDLSCVRVIVNGAEPISIKLCNEFLDEMSSYGLKENSIFPVYGLAEATLGVAFPPVKETAQSIVIDRRYLAEGKKILLVDDENGVDLVDLGYPLPCNELRITDSESNVLPSEHIGHIQIRGENVTRGYYNNEKATNKLILPNGWLNTGDLGFIKDNRLYITGRAKDVIFVNGQNYYSHDIERIVEDIPGAEMGKVVAVGIFNHTIGEERLVIFILFKKKDTFQFDQLASKLRERINKSLGVQVHNIVPVKKIPKTTSGKIQRFKLGDDYQKSLAQEEKKFSIKDSSKIKEMKKNPNKQNCQNDIPLINDTESIKNILRIEIAKLINKRVEEIDCKIPLSEFGMDSLRSERLVGILEQKLNGTYSPSIIWDYPTIDSLSEYLSRTATSIDNKEQDTSITYKNEPIAIIGMACRFPGGADNVESFWEQLTHGIDAISKISDERKKLIPFNENGSGQIGGFINNIETFDPQFFSISPREAIRMDPQQRLLLEVTWEALENSGIPLRAINETNTGVFIGISSNDYAKFLLDNDSVLNIFTGTGNSLAIAANRISYAFNLKGPSLAVDTACSSSLVSTHYACESIRRGESDMAIAGGVNILLLQELSQAFSKANMLSEDGRCKTFDVSANGYVRGEGCGIVILKRLSNAIKDGDNIIAVIRGSHVNQDGKSNGLTAPNGLAQRQVINQAMKNAGVGAKDISYIESHGTGTKLGDPIELNNLAEIFSNDRESSSPCMIGSIKTNIGHLESAAGIAGVIKTALCLQKKQVPPNLHFKKLNPYIVMDESIFKIPTAIESWCPSSSSRFAGVSSFGFGGTNSHIILQEAPIKSKTCSNNHENDLNILFLSAKRKKDLAALINIYSEYFKNNKEYSLSDICYSSNVGRNHFQYRAALVANSLDTMRENLDSYLNKLKMKGDFSPSSHEKLAFVFSGKYFYGTRVGEQLYNKFKVFKEAVDLCQQIIRKYIDFSIVDYICSNSNEKNNYTIREICVFVFEYALAQLWTSWGITPTAVTGYGVGEYVAACVSGVLDINDALKIVFVHTEIVNSLTAKDSIIIFSLDEENIMDELKKYSDISVMSNSNFDYIVVSGSNDKINNVTEYLDKVGIIFYQLPQYSTLHSSLIKDICDESDVESIKLKSPQIPFISEVYGKYVTEKQINTVQWLTQKLEPTSINASINYLISQGIDSYLVVSNSNSLCELLNRVLTSDYIVLPSLMYNSSTWRDILYPISKLYSYGFNLSWEVLAESLGSGDKVTLPTYPFDRQKYWFEITQKTVNKEERSLEMDSNYKKDVISLLREQTALIKQQSEMVATIMMDNNSSPSLLNTNNFASKVVVDRAIQECAADRECAIVSEDYQSTMSAQSVRNIILNILSNITAYPIKEIKPIHSILNDLGFDSIMAGDLVSQLVKEFPSLKNVSRDFFIKIYNEEKTVQDVESFIIEELKKDFIIEHENDETSREQQCQQSNSSSDKDTTCQFNLFPEYLNLKERLVSIGESNPYFKINQEIARDVININGNEMLNYSTYNYLGLNGATEVVDEAVQALKRFGTSVSGSRLLSGEIPLHRELEQEIANFLGTEDSIVYVGGYTTNVTTVGHLVGENDLIIHDSLIHNSVIQGCLMSGAARRPFPHNDWKALDEMLTMLRPNYRRILIIIEGVYSMDGDIANLPKFIEVKKRHNALLMVDEAHSLGTIGKNGKGIGEYYEIKQSDVDLWMGTLSKSLASCGGYIAGSKELIEYLKYSAPGFIFSVGISPSNTAAALAALDQLKANPKLVEKLNYNGQLFLKLAKEKGLNTGLSENTPIVPVILGDSEKCLKLSHSLLMRNINVMPIVYPAVDENAARLRFFLSTLHTEEQIDRTINILCEEISKIC